MDRIALTTFARRQTKNAVNFVAQLSDQQCEQFIAWLDSAYEEKETIKKYIPFLLEVLALEQTLQQYPIEQSVFAFVEAGSFDYSQLTMDQYEKYWLSMSHQSERYLLSYHTPFHGLEVAVRSFKLAESLRLFEHYSSAVGHFLRFLLMTAAKYHDVIQWHTPHVSPDYATAEEQSAASISKKTIEDLLIENGAVKLFIELFFKKTIGLGTKILFLKKKGMIALSHLYDEIYTLLYPDKRQDTQLLQWLNASTEIIGLMDKAAPIAVNSIEEATIPSVYTLIPLQDFFSQNQALSYTHLTIGRDISMFRLFHIAHFLMQLEFQKDNPAAILLRQFIVTGQTFILKNQIDNIQYLFEHSEWTALNDAFKVIYLSKLSTETTFVLNLKMACIQSIFRLKQLGYSEITSCVDPEIFDMEQQVLLALKPYCDALNETQHIEFVKTLLWIAMSQMGIWYAQYPQQALGRTEPCSLLSYFP